MQKKKFLSDLLFIQILNVLIKAFWILWIDREIQNFLPSEAYGQYYSLLGFSILFIILLDAGINNYNSREVGKDPQFFQHNFFNIIAAKLLLSVFYAIIAFAFAYFLNFDQEDMLILGLLLLFQIIASLNLYLRSNIAGHQEFKLDGILGVLDRLLVIFLCSFLLYHSSFQEYLNIEVFIKAQIIGVLFTFFIALFFNLKKLEKFQFTLNFNLLKSIIKKALPYALLIILMGLFTRMDVVMLKSMLPDHLQADAYAKAYRLLDAANMFAMLLSGMLLPLFSKMIKDKADPSPILKISSKLMLLPALPVIVLLLMHSSEVLQLLYPNKYSADLNPIFAYISLSFFGYALIYIYGTLLTALADLRYLNWAAAATALMNIALNLLLIPSKGALGAAIATLVCQSVFAFLCFFRAKSVFQFKMQSKEWGQLILVLISIPSLIYILKQFISNAIVHSLVSLLVSLIIYFSVKIFKSAEVRQLLRP